MNNRPVVSAGVALVAAGWMVGAARGVEVPMVERVVSTDNILVRSIAAADVDGDGDVDILSGNSEEGRAVWFRNLGGFPLQFDKHIVNEVRLRQPAHIRGVDLNLDGHMDILTIGIIGDTIAWYENDGNAFPDFIEHIITTDPDNNGPLQGPADAVRQIVAADFDGDGDVDVAAACVDNDSVSWWENLDGAGLSWELHFLTTTFDGARSIDAADLDNDGDVDIFAGAWYDQRVLWFENTGAGPTGFAERVVAVPPLSGGNDQPSTWRVYASDLDNDGDLDIVSARTREHEIAWYENDGNVPPAFTWRVISSNASFAKAVYAADLDNDGDQDVMSASLVDDKIAWYENLGGTPLAFTEHVLTEDPDGNGPVQGSADGARSIWAADLDADGDLEIIWCSRLNDKVAYHVNGLVPFCPPDLDDSGAVDIVDLVALLAAWGPCPDPPTACPGDFDADGLADVTDLLTLLSVWGPCD